MVETLDLQIHRPITTDLSLVWISLLDKNEIFCQHSLQFRINVWPYSIPRDIADVQWGTPRRFFFYLPHEECPYPPLLFPCEYGSSAWRCCSHNVIIRHQTWKWKANKEWWLIDPWPIPQSKKLKQCYYLGSCKIMWRIDCLLILATKYISGRCRCHKMHLHSGERKVGAKAEQVPRCGQTETETASFLVTWRAGPTPMFWMGGHWSNEMCAPSGEGNVMFTF